SDGGRGFAFSSFEQLTIADEIRGLEAGHSSLTCAEEFSRAAKLEVEFGDLESVVGANQGIQPALSVFRNLSPGHEDAIGLGGAPADASAQLVKLGETEALCVLDHHNRGIGHIDSDFDHRRRHQNVQLSLLKHAHHL